MLIINTSLAIPLVEIEFSYVRSSGPGGQNVNKVSSKAVMRWSILHNLSLPPGVRQRFLERYANQITVTGDLVITGSQFRDQKRNAEDCLEKLRSMVLLVAVPPKPRRKTKPTRGSKERRLSEKKSHGKKKQNRQGGSDF